MQQSFIMISETELKNIQSDLCAIKTMLSEQRTPLKPALKDWISQKEAMALLGLKYTSLYKLRRDGHLVSTSTRPIFYSLTSINEYLNSKK